MNKETERSESRVAPHGMTLLVSLLVTVFATMNTFAAERELSRGKRWLRAHPFWISALTQTERLYDVDAYRGAGLTTMLAWDPKPLLFDRSKAAGFPSHYHIHRNQGETPADYVEHAAAWVKQYPGCNGILFWDEPQTPYFETVAATVKALRAALPDRLIYSNALPKGAPAPKYGFAADSAPEDYYAAYFQKFAEEIQPDVMMIDIYPLGSDGGRSREYFETLLLVRQQGLRFDAPYWLFIQATDLDGRRRRPSESDLRFQLFAPLALGYTGIAYFSWGPAIGPGLIDGEAKPTPLYHHARYAIQEVAHLGRALRFLHSTAIGFRMGEGNGLPPTPPGGPWTWHAIRDRSKTLRDVTIEGGGPWRDVLVGLFEDDAGDEYFMVTNICHDKDTSAAAAAQDVTLAFAPGIRSMWRLSRETGQPEELVVRNGTLTLRLPGGTGDLFKAGDGVFPGLEQ